MYRDGADPLIVLQDILDLVYWLTRIKTAPTVADAAYTPEMERTRGKDMADKLSMPSLTRAWQLTLKGVGEVQSAPNALQAAQMALVRLAHAADLPAPAALVRQLTSGDAPALPTARSAPAGTGSKSVTTVASSENSAPDPANNGPAVMGATSPAAAPKVSLEPVLAPEQLPAAQLPQPQSFKEVADLFRERREMILYSQLQKNVHLVAFEIGRMEFRLTEGAPRDLANNVSSFLSDWTGRRWVITISAEEGEATLVDKARAEDQRLRDEAESDSLVQAVKLAFPGAKVSKVIPREPADAVLDEFEEDED
jgi:DNA polymerase-3 subunit gamma/tau